MALQRPQRGLPPRPLKPTHRRTGLQKRFTSSVHPTNLSAHDPPFRDKRTESVAAGTPHRAFQSIERQAWRRLEILDATTTLDDLRALASNRLEALRGDRRGQWSIRINDQWRICFEWPPGPSNVDIADEH